MADKNDALPARGRYQRGSAKGVCYLVLRGAARAGIRFGCGLRSALTLIALCVAGCAPITPWMPPSTLPFMGPQVFNGTYHPRSSNAKIGGEATYGPHARTADSREVVVKIAAKHDSRDALGLLGREIAPMSTGGVVGMTGSFGAGRASATPVIRMFSCLVPKTQVPVTIDLDGRQIPMQEGARSGGFTAAQLPVEAPPPPSKATGATETVPLVALAYGRSGDKGDNANIGIFARKPEYVPILDSEVTEDAVAQYFAHRINGKVTRWRLPGIGGFNFLLRQALGGGGMASLKADPLAKAFAQMLLDMPIKVPAEMARELAT